MDTCPSISGTNARSALTRNDASGDNFSRHGRLTEWLVFVSLFAIAVWMFAAWASSDGTNSVESVDEANSPALIG